MNAVQPMGQGGRDERRAGGDEPRPPGTRGGRFGLSGEERRALLMGWLLAMAIVGLVMIFDILTRTHDVPADTWTRATIDEASSALVNGAVLLLPMGIALWIRRRAPALWARAIAYVAGAATYSVLHVSGFVALRRLAYAAWLGHAYDFGRLPDEFLYEAGKDVPAFVFASAITWLILRWRLDGAAAAPGAASPEVFDIRDGQRLVRAPLAQILAVRSAGNYAEFVLADGRRPLMRSPLAALEARLGPHGFVRTHRSWLINIGRVTGLRPEGSGDYAVELGDVEAPLSRRFPQALKALRT